MQITFLGTSSGVPTRSRNVSSVALRLPQRAEFWLFDCGEGTQHQILRSDLRISQLTRIFITHMHGDHIFGLMGLLASYGLAGERISGLTGVWVEGKKVAAIGIKVSRWVTMHGFALNVCPDMTGFEKIVPCGIKDKKVGSLAEWIPHIDCLAVRPRVAECFAKVFGVKLQDVKMV